VLRIGVPLLALCFGSCLNFRKVDDAKAPGDLLGVYDGRSFSIVSQVAVTISEPGRGKSGCQVLRHDKAKGKLSDDGAEVESFEGTLGFSYEAVAGSDCSEWVGSPGAVATLPCALSYDIEAERSADE
jgi:hypothetical protein